MRTQELTEVIERVSNQTLEAIWALDLNCEVELRSVDPNSDMPTFNINIRHTDDIGIASFMLKAILNKCFENAFIFWVLPDSKYIKLVFSLNEELVEECKIGN
jgi:hypothetical protein